MGDTSNTADIIDSRDVIARIEELEENEERTEHENVELADLRKLATYGASYVDDWEYGACLVRGTYFKDYARDWASDTGALKGPQKWPYTCIDWDQAARELQDDFTELDYDGVPYFAL